MSEDLKSGIVRILWPDGSTAGTGFLVRDSGLIVTCSHVIQHHEQQEKKQRPNQVTIVFRASGNSRTAQIIAEWWSGYNAEDVAFLQVVGNLPEGTKPLPLSNSKWSKEHRFETFGFPDSNPEGGEEGTGDIFGSTDIRRGTGGSLRPVLQIGSWEVTQGFSGAPVWDTHMSRVIGMVTVIKQPDANLRGLRTGFITPAETLKSICPVLQLSEPDFNWLQWPSGFASLDDRMPKGFRAFLHSEKLPYLARDSWQPPRGLRHQLTETRLVEALNEEEVSNPVVVLTGSGGVGKTRLGLETARRMRKLGWSTIRCDGRATVEGLQQILAQSFSPARLLLFVDYLETWPGFEAFADEVSDRNEDTHHQIRVIATCRASYRDRLPSFIRPNTAGGTSDIETAYSKAVTQHILSALDREDTESLAQKCRHNFALAAFLLFMKQANPDKFQAELGALRQVPTFEEWIVKRLQNAKQDVYKVAAILAACPFPVTAFDALATAHKAVSDELRHVLDADKWIEHREPDEGSADGPVWAAFHDIFSDVVLERALKYPKDGDWIDRLLQLAAANGVFAQTLAALGRLSKSETIKSIDWSKRLLELERRIPGALASHAPVLLANALLSPQTRVSLVAANAALRQAVADDPACDLGVAHTAADWPYAQATADEQSEFESILLPMLDAAVARGHQPNMVLRIGFRARPDRYRAAARQWIDTHRRVFQTHFLLKAWLDQSVDELKSGNPKGTENIEAVREAVKEWLWASAGSFHTSFALASWLDAAAAIGGPRADAMVKEIEGDVTAWLAHGEGEYATSFEASFVYQSWLESARGTQKRRFCNETLAIRTMKSAISFSSLGSIRILSLVRSLNRASAPCAGHTTRPPEPLFSNMLCANQSSQRMSSSPRCVGVHGFRIIWTRSIG
jgi:Trypsin-like peptidase domain